MREVVSGGDHAHDTLIAAVCVGGPALVALIPMAAAPAMPAMAARFADGGDGQLFAQLVMTAPAMMLILASPIAGLLAERFGRRICLLASLLLYVVAGASALMIDDRVLLIFSRLLLGVAGGGLLTSSLALIGEHFDAHRRERILGYATGLSSLVAALALMFGGSLVDHFGWRAPFALYLAGLPLYALAYAFIGHSKRLPHETGGRRSGHAAALSPVIPIYILLTLLTIGMFTPAIQAPFLLQARGIDSAATQGAIVAAASIVAIFSASGYGLIRRFLSTYAVLAVDALCMGGGIMLIALAPGLPLFILGCGLVGVGAGMSEPATASLIFDRTPPWIHALAMGLVVSALNLGQFVNPLVMDPLRHALGPVAAFAGLGGLLVIVGLMLAVMASGEGRRRLRPAAYS